MTVLVTGAAGFIGSHSCEALLEQGRSVVGIDSFDDFYPRVVKERNLEKARSFERFTFLEGDIRDREFLAALPADVSTIVHLAARAGVRPSIEQPALYSAVNVLGTTHLLDLAHDRGIRSFVFASSSSVYGNNRKVPFSEADPVDHPISPYAATKKAGELSCHVSTHLHGITTVCLRFFTVYGPRQRPDLAIHKFARLMMQNLEVPMFGDGSTSRDYTFIDDILEGVKAAVLWAEEHEGRHEIINLGEEQTITLREMIRVIGKEMNVDPRIRQLPMQPGDVTRTYADVSKARRILGYEPRTDFPDGVRRFLDWLRAQPAISD